MANDEHLTILQEGIERWNLWRQNNSDIRPDLSGGNFYQANLSGGDFHQADLSEASLDTANLSKADFTAAYLRRAYLSEANLSGANFRAIKASSTLANLSGDPLERADLRDADLSDANLSDADLSDADLQYANFTGATLNRANLTGANLTDANLTGANLTDANLIDADLQRATLVSTNLNRANLSNCRIFGISAWSVVLKDAIQRDLIITPDGKSSITVDNLEVAQFIYLLLHNEKIRDVIDTITSKAVLILGRFTLEQKIVLDAIREELRKHNYTPILFDFEKPSSRDLTETVMTLAGISRFVIADLSDPNSIPHELMSFVEKLPSVPVRAIFRPVLAHKNEYPMFEHLKRYPQVIRPIYRYKSQEQLMTALYEKVILPAEKKVKQMRSPS